MSIPLTNEYLSTTQTAGALGVSVSTVKRWVEDGILSAHKTAGGHRKLLLADVLELARQNGLPLKNPSLLKAGGRKLRAASSEQLSEGLYESLLDGDAEAVRRILHGSYDRGLALESMADEVIAPAMHRIGRDWEAGRIDVLHEHRASQVCSSVLFELKGLLEARARRDRPVAVGGAVEGDFSELPTLLAQMVLLDAGWDAVNLGANTPLSSFTLAIDECVPRLLWISISHLPQDDAFEKKYRALYRKAEQANVAVVVGGQALAEPIRASIPYTAYGDGLKHLAAFARTLNPRPRRPRRGRPPQ